MTQHLYLPLIDPRHLRYRWPHLLQARPRLPAWPTCLSSLSAHPACLPTCQPERGRRRGCWRQHRKAVRRLSNDPDTSSSDGSYGFSLDTYDTSPLLHHRSCMQWARINRSGAAVHMDRKNGMVPPRVRPKAKDVDLTLQPSSTKCEYSSQCFSPAPRSRRRPPCPAGLVNHPVRKIKKVAVNLLIQGRNNLCQRANSRSVQNTSPHGPSQMKDH